VRLLIPDLRPALLSGLYNDTQKETLKFIREYFETSELKAIELVPSITDILCIYCSNINSSCHKPELELVFHRKTYSLGVYSIDELVKQFDPKYFQAKLMSDAFNR